MIIKWYYIALNCIDAIKMILSECDWGATNVGPSEKIAGNRSFKIYKYWHRISIKRKTKYSWLTFPRSLAVV